MNEQLMRNPARQDEEDYIDLLALFFALLRNWWIMLLAASVMGTVFFVGARLTTVPVFQSSFTAYINNSSQTVQPGMMTSSDIMASRDLASTYSEIIVSQPVVEAAIKEANLTLEYADVAGYVSVSDVNDTEIIQVRVTSPDPQIAYQMACAMEVVAPEYVSDIVIGSSMKTVAPAEFPTAAINGNYTKKAVLGFLMGGFAVAAVVVLLELLDKRVKSAEELEEQYGIVVIGTIHDLASSQRSGYGYYGRRKGGKA